MRKGIGIAVAVAAGVLVSSLNASAVILIEKSEAQKLRADIQKQQHGYTKCLVKAATNCEKSGNLVASECNLNTGLATPPADAKTKFAIDIGKCDAKLNFMKKAKTLTTTTGYTAFGCPGDADTVTAGDQPHADIAAWQAATPVATKAQIQTLATALGSGITLCDTLPTVKEQQKCQAAEVKRVANYAFAIQKCQLSCENDFKNKKGNGGTTDSTTAYSLNAAGTAGAGDANFNTCVSKAYAKLTKTPLPGVVGIIVITPLATALNDANNDINNENDCP